MITTCMVCGGNLNTGGTCPQCRGFGHLSPPCLYRYNDHKYVDDSNSLFSRKSFAIYDAKRLTNRLLAVVKAITNSRDTPGCDELASIAKEFGATEEEIEKAKIVQPVMCSICGVNKSNVGVYSTPLSEEQSEMHYCFDCWPVANKAKNSEVMKDRHSWWKFW